MHEIVRRMDVDFILRSDTVDLASLDWICGSQFMSTALAHEDWQPEDMVVDLGSHVGSFALPLVRRFACRALLCEPDEASLRLSRASALLNRLDDRVEALLCAVGGRDGRLRLYESDQNWGHTTIAGGGPWNVLTGVSCEIDALSLASVFERAGPARRLFVKVNIEGAEFDMFEQAEVQTLARADTYVGEVHYDLGRPDFTPARQRLEQAGFDVVLHPMGDLRAILVAQRR